MDILKEAEPVLDTFADANQPEMPPDRNSAEWTQYVLKKFEPNELDDLGNPTVDGLSRIARILIGPILASISKVVCAPHPDNRNKATVEHFLKIKDVTLGEVCEYQEVADAGPDNVRDKTYSIFSTAMASTRARGRSLRQALNLYHIVAAEELSNKENEDCGPIEDTQALFMENICKRLDVHLLKFINIFDEEGKLTPENIKNKKITYKDIRELDKETARIMCETIGEWQRNKSLIPDVVKGWAAYAELLEKRRNQKGA